MPNRISRLFKNITMKYDCNDYNSIKELVEDYQEWLVWNKTYETIEVIESKQFEGVIVIIHRFFDIIKISDGSEFIKDIKYLLQMYASNSTEDLEYMLDFWENKI